MCEETDNPLLEKISFEDLFDLDDIQRIQDQFALATGVASIITTPEGVPITQPSNFCRLCRDIIRNTEKGLNNCFKSDAAVGQYNPSGPIIQPCLSGGLWDGGAGISVGGIHIANWLIGQVRNEAQSDERMLAYAREIGADEGAFAEALAEVKVMSTEQFKEVCKALFLFANQLSRTAFQNFRQTQIIAERKKAEDELAKAKSYIDNIINSMPSILVGVDRNIRVTLWNNKAAEATGISARNALTRDLKELLPYTEEEIRRIYNAIAAQNVYHRTDMLRRERQRIIHEEITVYPLGPEGAVIRIDDFTERHEMERQVAQIQKMDAIGQLAGGVAHDFNNMLGGIINAADMLHETVAVEDRQYVALIRKSAQRVADLTSKLLAFSRQGKVTNTLIDLHATIENTIALLERSIDKKITIKTALMARTAAVTGDEFQLQNVLLNIGINAGQAMPGGGELTFSTLNTTLDSAACSGFSFKLEPGNYLVIKISDTGVGIPVEIMDRIFEPFFTTKPQGQGTGLGLSAAYGAICEHHGAVTVSSRTGRGTTFEVYLPVSKSPGVRPKATQEIIRGTGCILLVDDEESIRQTTKAILERLHYDVITAQNGLEAVEIFQKEHGRIDLILLDLLMPKMNGRETFEKIKEIDPAAKVIIASGFHKDEDIDNLMQQGLNAFIRKPYGIPELSQLVAGVMGAGRKK